MFLNEIWPCAYILAPRGMTTDTPPYKKQLHRHPRLIRLDGDMYALEDKNDCSATRVNEVMYSLMEDARIWAQAGDHHLCEVEMWNGQGHDRRQADWFLTYFFRL